RAENSALEASRSPVVAGQRSTTTRIAARISAIPSVISQRPFSEGLLRWSTGDCFAFTPKMLLVFMGPSTEQSPNQRTFCVATDPLRFGSGIRTNPNRMLTRGNVEALSKKLENPKAAFETALERSDVDQAAAIALAAGLTQQPLGLAELARIAADVSVPDVLLPLFARAPGSVEPLLPTLELDEHRAALVLAAEVSKLEGAPPKWLIDTLADHIDRSITDASYELLVACAYQLDVPELFAVRHSVRTYLNAADARDVWATVKRDIAKPLAILPEQELSLPVVSVKHGGDGPGRNDPCPCGSGQKYKKCHGAEGGLEATAKSRAERLTELLPRLESKHVLSLTAADLRRIELAKVPLKLALAVFREWMFRQRWHEAEAALEQVCLHPERKAPADGYRDEFIWQALQNRRLADAQRQHAKVEKPEQLTPVLDIHAGLLTQWPDWLELSEDVCVEAAKTGQLLDLVDLTYVLLQRAPGLGLWLASALYDRLKPEEADTLFTSMDDARDRLGLPSVAARQGRKHLRSAEEKQPAKKIDPKEKAKIRALETTLEESKRKMRQIEQALEKEKAKASVEAPAPAAAPGARKAFAQRIDELEDRIREGNAERAGLRREVAELTERLEQGKGVPPPKVEPVAEEPGESATRPRGLMLAQWEPRAVESLEALPARVSEDVLVKIAELGSGDAAHWIEVKQLQGVAGLYTARIGIHYRALFTIEGKTLRVHEVVHREGFDTALRRFK
ncbi:MAG: hypothetical protein H6Q89_4682, partial [Myxococcaceae bacterium]|nr:hypothetical protein [Myxococcaceae bacterium]